LQFKFHVLDEEFQNEDGKVNQFDPSALKSGADDGVYIYGLYLESARWDASKHCVVEQAPGEMASAMPLMHFLPFEVKHRVVPNKNLRVDAANENQ